MHKDQIHLRQGWCHPLLILLSHCYKYTMERWLLQDRCHSQHWPIQSVLKEPNLLNSLKLRCTKVTSINMRVLNPIRATDHCQFQSISFYSGVSTGGKLWQAIVPGGMIISCKCCIYWTKCYRNFQRWIFFYCSSSTVDCKLVDQLQVQSTKSLNHRSKQYTHEFYYLIS